MIVVVMSVCPSVLEDVDNKLGVVVWTSIFWFSWLVEIPDESFEVISEVSVGGFEEIDDVDALTDETNKIFKATLCTQRKAKFIHLQNISPH